MAITATHYRLFKSLPLPQGGSLLEIGEANWYGDVNPRLAFLTSPHDREIEREAWEAIKGEDLFAIAKAFYKVTFAPSRLVAIDYNGTPSALRLDLNQPINSGHDESNENCPVNDPETFCNPATAGLPCCCSASLIGEPFDVVINHGTAEHIFNIAQVFRTMHDACADGGLMVHDAPFTGWIDHGFYCLQPTLFYDLAAANNYEVVRVAIHAIESQQIIPLEGRDHVAKLAAAGTLPPNSMLFVALRKYGDSPFKIPTQGYYAGKLSEAGKHAWETLR
jgi:hypothetical protein